VLKFTKEVPTVFLSNYIIQYTSCWSGNSVNKTEKKPCLKFSVCCNPLKEYTEETPQKLSTTGDSFSWPDTLLQCLLHALKSLHGFTEKQISQWSEIHTWTRWMCGEKHFCQELSVFCTIKPTDTTGINGQQFSPHQLTLTTRSLVATIWTTCVKHCVLSTHYIYEYCTFTNINDSYFHNEKWQCY
jgi:hypothetical protein